MTLGRLLLCTDLDRTLIPNGPQPESPMARQHLLRLVNRPEVCLVYVSGRHRALVEQAISQYGLPVPDFVIGDVGTSIYAVGPDSAWSKLDAWERQISADWGERSHADLKRLLNGIDGLRAQEDSKQNLFKLSYYLPADIDTGVLSSLVRKRLEAAGVSARLIFSVDEIEQTGLLDVLPSRASKLHAIEALMEQNGFGLNNTVFCGDSGNDMDVLVSPVPSVLVANSQPDIQSHALECCRHNGTEKQLYIASGNLLSMNGNYAAGMLEGITHFYPETLDWLGQSIDATETMAS